MHKTRDACHAPQATGMLVTDHAGQHPGPKNRGGNRRCMQGKADGAMCLCDRGAENGAPTLRRPCMATAGGRKLTETHPRPTPKHGWQNYRCNGSELPSKDHASLKCMHALEYTAMKEIEGERGAPPYVAHCPAGMRAAQTAQTQDTT